MALQLKASPPRPQPTQGAKGWWAFKQASAEGEPASPSVRRWELCGGQKLYQNLSW
jgi:hypothetical protein